MKEEKDKLEILQQYAAQAENEELNFNILDKAKTAAESIHKGKHNRGQTFWLRIFVPAVSACLVAAIALTTVLLWPTTDDPEDDFDGIKDVYSVEVESISDFCSENELNVHYFSMMSLAESAEAYYLSENDEFAFFIQKMSCFNFIGIDMIELGVQVLDESFSNFDIYLGLETPLQYGEIVVLLNVEEVDATFVTLAKFEVNKVFYYIKITSFSEDILTHYLDLLLN